MAVYNFNAGPAVLPKSVMLKAQEEFVDYHGCGYGIAEESHRLTKSSRPPKPISAAF